MKPFNSCCLCCKLETGAYVLAAIGLIGCILNIVLGSLVLERVIEINIPGTTIIYQIVWCVAGLIVYAMLIAGTKKRNCGLLIPYLIFDMLGIIINVLACITYLTKASENEMSTAIPAIFGFAFGLLLAVYIWLCMYSLYLKIKNEKNTVETYKGLTV